MLEWLNERQHSVKLFPVGSEKCLVGAGIFRLKHLLIKLLN